MVTDVPAVCKFTHISFSIARYMKKPLSSGKPRTSAAYTLLHSAWRWLSMRCKAKTDAFCCCCLFGTVFMVLLLTTLVSAFVPGTM